MLEVKQEIWIQKNRKSIFFKGKIKESHEWHDEVEELEGKSVEQMVNSRAVQRSPLR